MEITLQLARQESKPFVDETVQVVAYFLVPIKPPFDIDAFREKYLRDFLRH